MRVPRYDCLNLAWWRFESMAALDDFDQLLFTQLTTFSNQKCKNRLMCYTLLQIDLRNYLYFVWKPQTAPWIFNTLLFLVYIRKRGNNFKKVFCMHKLLNNILKTLPFFSLKCQLSHTTLLYGFENLFVEFWHVFWTHLRI